MPQYERYEARIKRAVDHKRQVEARKPYAPVPCRTRDEALRLAEWQREFECACKLLGDAERGD